MVPGVVFINEVHMLDIECFTYLDALLESPMVQTVVLAMNHGQALVRGMVDIISRHGIPVNFIIGICLILILLRWLPKLRCMIMKMDGYTHDRIGQVVQLCASVEGLKLGQCVVDQWAAEGQKSSLLYAHWSFFVF